MRATLTLALALAALVAVAGVAGYAVMSHSFAPTGAAAGNVGTVGTLDVVMQDAPAANWSHVYVTYSVLQVHMADTGNDTSGAGNLSASAGNTSEWSNVSLVQRTVDLASTTSVASLLGSATLKAGMYTQLRIVVQSVQGVMTNGTKVTFVVPSGELKTADAFNITVGQTTSLTVSLDLSRSIVQAGSTWIFTPVLGSIQTS